MRLDAFGEKGENNCVCAWSPVRMLKTAETSIGTRVLN